MAERLSLADRFGLRIGYFKPEKQQYLDIVRALAGRVPQIQLSDDELALKAEQWAMRNGERSGRAARNFINSL